MEKCMVNCKTALSPSLLPGLFSLPRPASSLALHWSKPTLSLQNLKHFNFYSSSIARFLRPNPIDGKPENAQSWNLYAYVGNNPVNANDPTGMDLHVVYELSEKSGGDSAVGHVFLIVTEGNTDKVLATWDFQPTDWSYWESSEGMQGPGILGEGMLEAVIETTPEQDKELADKINDRKKQGETFCPLTNNCATTSAEIASEIAPLDVLAVAWLTYPAIHSPQAVFLLAKRIEIAQRMDKAIEELMVKIMKEFAKKFKTKEKKEDSTSGDSGDATKLPPPTTTQ